MRLSPDKFQQTCFVIIDTLIAELNRLISAYSSITERFVVFWECLDQEGKVIRVAAQRLVAAYESDLKVDSVDECIQFQKLLKTELGKLVAVPNQYESGDSVEKRMHKLITSANLQSVFPNIEIALRICVCLMVTIIVLANVRFQNLNASRTSCVRRCVKTI